MILYGGIREDILVLIRERKTALPPQVNSFLGVPFAEPPTGARRWTSPQKVKPWKVGVDVFPPFISC
jgi:hypothetical protein